MSNDREADLLALMKIDAVELTNRATRDEVADPPSTMTEALLDSGARPIKAIVPAFATNEGTVFLGSPADIKRMELMNIVTVYRGHTYHPDDLEIDRLMKEDR